ncbi:unnamed protein product [Closterium sp. Yama58-4]|nr:unnamed protein product [Closterium sp. Yama58-4]
MSSVPRIVLSPSVPRVDLSACPRRSQAELAARGLLLPPKPGTLNTEGAETRAASGGSNQAANTGGDVCAEKVEKFQTCEPATVGSGVSEESRVKSDGGKSQSAGNIVEATSVAVGDGKSAPSDCNEGHYVEVEWSVEVARVVRVRRLSRRLVFLDVEIMSAGDDMNVRVMNARGMKHMEQQSFQQQQQQQQEENQRHERDSLAASMNDVSSAVVDVSGTLEVALKYPTCPDVRANARHAHVGRLVSLRGPLIDLQPARAPIKAANNEEAQVPPTFRLPLFFAASLTPFPGVAATGGRAEGECAEERHGELAESGEEDPGGANAIDGASAGAGAGTNAGAGAEALGWRIVAPGWGVWENLPGGGGSDGARKGEGEAEWAGEVHDGGGGAEGGKVRAEGGKKGAEGGNWEAEGGKRGAEEGKHYLNSGHCSAAPFCARAHPPPALLPLLRLHWIAHRQHRRRHCCSQGEGDPHSVEGKRGKQVRAELFAAWLVGTFGRGRLMGEGGGATGGSWEREDERETGDGVEGEGSGEMGDGRKGGGGRQGRGGGKGGSGGKGVLDVAGGRGALAFALEQRHGVRATVVDPRGVRLNKKQVRELMGVDRRCILLDALLPGYMAML